jgi:hypothetical protein
VRVPCRLLKTVSDARSTLKLLYDWLYCLWQLLTEKAVGYCWAFAVSGLLLFKLKFFPE